jgi:hypothetical protein
MSVDSAINEILQLPPTEVAVIDRALEEYRIDPGNVQDWETVPSVLLDEFQAQRLTSS